VTARVAKDSRERGWPAIDAVRDEIAAAKHRHDRRRHLTVLHQRHVTLVADQIRYELAAQAADRARGRQHSPSAAAPAGGKPVPTLPAETVAPADNRPRPDSNPRISVHPGGAAVERDDAYAEIGYPRRKGRG
jgi:hypothetical protein